MIGKPEDIPDAWRCWAQVEPYSMTEGGYVVNRVHDGDNMKLATFICESDATLFATLKNDALKRGGSI